MIERYVEAKEELERDAYPPIVPVEKRIDDRRRLSKMMQEQDDEQSSGFDFDSENLI